MRSWLARRCARFARVVLRFGTATVLSRLVIPLCHSALLSRMKTVVSIGACSGQHRFGGIGPVAALPETLSTHQPRETSAEQGHPPRRLLYGSAVAHAMDRPLSTGSRLDQRSPSGGTARTGCWLSSRKETDTLERKCSGISGPGQSFRQSTS